MVEKNDLEVIREALFLANMCMAIGYQWTLADRVLLQRASEIVGELRDACS